MRRGDERVSTHIQVEQRALRALEQHFLARLDRVPGHDRGVAHHRAQAVGIDAVFRDHRVRIDRLAAVNAGDHAVFARAGLADDGFKALCVHKIVHADAAALGFIHIGRADALFGRADGGAFLGLFRLAQRVQLQMPGHDAVAARIDEQLVGRHALFVQAVDLAQDRLGVDDHARPDDVNAVRIQNAGRDELQLIFLVVYNNRVAGVVAALAAHHQIRLACENINELALALVAPLGAENNLTWHRISFLSSLGRVLQHVIRVKYTIGPRLFQSCICPNYGFVSCKRRPAVVK